MSGDLYDFIKKIRGEAPNPQGPKVDFWKPKMVGRTALRFYRFMDGDQQKLAHPFQIHRMPGEKFPIHCSGADCKVCETANRLRQDPMTKEKGWEIRAQAQFAFVAVLVNDPTKFVIWEASTGAAKKVLPSIAKEAGWTGGWPNGSEFEDFYKQVEEGAAKICGPRGHDVIVTAVRKDFEGREGFMVESADVVRTPGKTLPFEEDASIPSPKEKRAAIEAWRNRQEGRPE